MIEICYKIFCIVIILFILSLFFYQLMKNNYKESINLTEDEITKMGKVDTDLIRLKTKQANIIKKINDIKTETKKTKEDMEKSGAKIDAALNISKKKADDAQNGNISE